MASSSLPFAVLAVCLLGVWAIRFFSWADAPRGKLRITDADRRLLHEQGRYYTGLTPAQRKRFEQRVVDIVYEKEWEGQGLTVTREMMVRIAAAMAQITFGYKDLLLLYFKRIVIHPDAYENPHTGQRHIGEVAPKARAVVFSWKHFLAGFDDPHDGRNVGLHEVAHALWFANVIPNPENRYLPADWLEHWNTLAKDEMEAIRAGRSRLFRAYAGTNAAEFFAVAVEYFFEQPERFEAEAVELFRTLCVLMRQHPGARSAL